MIKTCARLTVCIVCVRKKCTLGKSRQKIIPADKIVDIVLLLYTYFRYLPYFWERMSKNHHIGTVTPSGITRQFITYLQIIRSCHVDYCKDYNWTKIKL